jgi:hypothetical protein
MAEQTKQSPAAGQSPLTHVTLTFDRKVTDEEVKQMQLQHNAISAAAGGGGHHDHDHPKLF